MMRKIGVLILLLASCGSSSMTCTSSSDLSGGHASCSGTVGTLETSRVLTFDLEDIATSDSVHGQFTLTITGGMVRIAYQNHEGRTVITQAVANQPLTVSGEMRLEDDEVQITLDALGGTATGVTYMAEFTR
jgi:hypothetical protein